MKLLTIIPSPKVSEEVDLYNAVMSFHQLGENVDECMLLDNEVLHGIFFRTEADDLRRWRHLVSTSISGVTTCLRFLELWNCDKRKLALHLIPYSRLHVLITFFARPARTTRIMETVPIIPLSEVSDAVVVAPSSAVLSFPQLVENADERWYDICVRTGADLVSASMTGVATCTFTVAAAPRRKLSGAETMAGLLSAFSHVRLATMSRGVITAQSLTCHLRHVSGG